MTMAIVELLVIALILIGVGVGAAVGLDRYKQPRSATAVPTDEVFVDPTTKVRTRVWVDPTGHRDYRADTGVDSLGGDTPSHSSTPPTTTGSAQ